MGVKGSGGSKSSSEVQSEAPWFGDPVEGLRSEVPKKMKNFYKLMRRF